MKDKTLNGRDEKIVNEMVDAINNGDVETFVNINQKQLEDLEAKILKNHEELKDETNESILRARGVFMPTDEEKKFLDACFKNTVGMSPTSGGTLIIPKTLVQRIFDDLREGSEDGSNLLADIDFVNTTGQVEWLVSVADKPVMTWGEICDPITKELSAAFKITNAQVNKLSAYIPWCKSLIDLGYPWQEQYIREYLALGLRSGLIKAYISGTGINMPFGMLYDYDIDTKQGTKKTATKITALDRKNFKAILKAMSKNPMGYTRPIKGLVTLYVDSDSYYDYIYEADDGITPEGNHYSKLEKMGIRVVVLDTGLTAGQAIIGLPKKYFGQVAFRDNGEISFSDDYLFLEDKRVWKAKLYAHGFAKDNNAFALLDLTGLTATI